VDTWGDSTLAEHYARLTLATLPSTTPDERRDLAWILARRSGKEISTVHGILPDLAENGVQLGAGALGTMLEALSEKPEAVWNLLETLPRSARLRHPAAWLALLEKRTLDHFLPGQQAHTFALLLDSVESEAELEHLAALLPLLGPNLAEPTLGAAVEQVLPALLDKMESLPREHLLNLASAVAGAPFEPFSDPDSALAVLQLVLEAAGRCLPEEAATCVAALFRRAARSGAVLGSDSYPRACPGDAQAHSLSETGRLAASDR
jgi:hypothetical protein